MTAKSVVCRRSAASTQAILGVAFGQEIRGQNGVSIEQALELDPEKIREEAARHITQEKAMLALAFGAVVHSQERLEGMPKPINIGD